jgi:pimeloyl-ACP methyl ester carboxylesterase
MKPFTIEWQQEKFDHLRSSAKAFEMPRFLCDDDWAHGCSPAYLRSFIDFWVNDFSLENCVAELNRFPQVVANVDGLEMHAVHVVGEAEGKNPLVLLHGWPGSVYEFWEVIEPLAFPSRFGASKSEAFDVVVPSLPGFGFSGKPPSPIGARTTAGIVNKLMHQLGYDRYWAQGGDWGSGIATWLGIDHPEAIKGIHLNYLLVQPSVQPETDEERQWKSNVERAQQELGAYAHLQQTRPASLAYAMHDNVAAQAAWMIERFYDWSDRRERPFEEIFSKKRLLTNILIYLMNDAFTSATYFYLGGRLEDVRQMPKGTTVNVPTAVTFYPDPRTPAAPKSWMQKGYALERFNEAPKGGHFAAMEVPSFFVEDLRRWLSESRLS